MAERKGPPHGKGEASCPFVGSQFAARVEWAELPLSLGWIQCQMAPQERRGSPASEELP